MHLHLQRTLGLPAPRYFHVPLVLDSSGHKLAKQTGALGLDPKNAATIAVDVLRLLGAEVPSELEGAGPAQLWQWAIGEWRIDKLSGRRAWPTAVSSMSDPGPAR